jgi:hypothetical protein
MSCQKDYLVDTLISVLHTPFTTSVSLLFQNSPFKDGKRRLLLRRTLGVYRCEQRRSEVAIPAIGKDYDNGAALHGGCLCLHMPSEGSQNALHLILVVLSFCPRQKHTILE